MNTTNYKEFIKDSLLGNKPKVYSLIVKHYQTQLSDLGAMLFADWFAKEIDIDRDKINVSSLNSAIARVRKAAKALKKAKEDTATEKETNPSVRDKEGKDFLFSDPFVETRKSRIQEG